MQPVRDFGFRARTNDRSRCIAVLGHFVRIKATKEVGLSDRRTYVGGNSNLIVARFIAPQRNE